MDIESINLDNVGVALNDIEISSIPNASKTTPYDKSTRGDLA